MTKDDFCKSLPAVHRGLIEKLLPVIASHEAHVHWDVGQAMGAEMLIYRQDGEFKYAFSSHNNHLSFHAMVMYCYPELHRKHSKLMKSATFQKGCINFKDGVAFPFAAFEEFIRDAATFQYPSPRQIERRERMK